VSSGGGTSLPVVDSTAIVKGSVTDGKQMRFEVDGFAGATTRVMTVPDKNITIADNADVTAHTSAANPHTGSAADGANSDITSLSGLTTVLSVAQGGTGVANDTYDARYVNGCDTGISTGNVFKIPASIAQGDIFYVDVSGNVVRMAAGTNGHYLKTQGAAANPVWATVGGGADYTIDGGDANSIYTGTATIDCGAAA